MLFLFWHSASDTFECLPQNKQTILFFKYFFNLRFLKAKIRQKNPNLFFPLTKNNVSHFGDLNKCKIFFYLEFPFVDYLEYEYTSPPITKMLVFLVVVHLIIIAFNLKNLCPSMFAILFLYDKVLYNSTCGSK